MSTSGGETTWPRRRSSRVAARPLLEVGQYPSKPLFAPGLTRLLIPRAAKPALLAHALDSPCYVRACE